MWSSLIAFALGSGLTYVLDRGQGRRRRALLRDKVLRSFHRAGDAIDVTRRDVRNRARGMVAELRSQLHSQPVSDAVLAERVKAMLGGVARHPGSIDVSVRDGRVMLMGPVFADEVARIVARVRSVRGVREVENRMDAHASAEGVSGLQGAPARRRAGDRFELLQTWWSPTARVLVGGAAAVASLWGVRRAGVVGTTTALAGGALLTRALTNLEFRRLLGLEGHGAVTVQKTIEVRTPLEEAFALWSRYENFPRFMSHVREVERLSESRSRWTVGGPAGVPVQWETEVVQFVPNRLIAWRTLPGTAVIAHEGEVRFDPSPDGSTRVHVRMCYNPLGGGLGHSLAKLLGRDPRQAMDEDLVRFKSLLEDGTTRAHGQRVMRNELG
jgi:uncharacterized membrane protein